MATLSLPVARPLFQGVSEFIADAKARYALYREYRETLELLSSFTARELADIGNGHMTAEALAYEAVYGTK